MATSASASTTLLSANCNERETFLNGQRCGMAPRDDVARRDGMRADGCVALKHRSQQSTDMSRHCRLWRGYSHFAVASVLCSYFVTHESFVWCMQNRRWWWGTLGIVWTLYRCGLDVGRGATGGHDAKTDRTGECGGIPPWQRAATSKSQQLFGRAENEVARDRQRGMERKHTPSTLLVIANVSFESDLCRLLILTLRDLWQLSRNIHWTHPFFFLNWSCFSMPTHLRFKLCVVMANIYVQISNCNGWFLFCLNIQFSLNV